MTRRVAPLFWGVVCWPVATILVVSWTILVLGWLIQDAVAVEVREALDAAHRVSA
jgi:hypothetical protein